MGLVKNLTPDEILSQVYWAKMSIRKHNLQPLKNIVFMGMGDIGKNLASVRAAAQVLTDQNRFGIAPSKVTLSTVGPTPDTFHELAQIPGTLAWR
jgi:adenine C2-methylase RlmN of 23S rRNA A2503 and tRNA A37